MSEFDNYRDEATEWAKQLLIREDWVILDTETTGLGSTAEIVQIGIIDHKGATILSTLVHPKEPIPADATAIHGITNKDVERAPDFPSVWAVLEPIFRTKEIVIYNADFDLRIIRQCVQRHNIDHQINLSSREMLAWRTSLRASCAMLVYAQWYGEWSDYRGSFKWQPLRGGDHSAIGDCLATLALIKKMAVG